MYNIRENIYLNNRGYSKTWLELIDTVINNKNYIKELNNLYSSKKTDTSIAFAKNYLTKNIIPSDFFLIAGEGTALKTKQGKIIDLASMTVNCVLGQNDPWVKLKQIAYLLSDRPSFHSSKFGTEPYYHLAFRLSQLKVGGIKNPVINHKQCNGSDSVEVAIKAAHNHRGKKKKFVSFLGSYHGQNLTSYYVSHVQREHIFLTHNSDVVFLEAPTNTMSIDNHDGLSSSEQATLEQFKKIAPDTYGVILEPIQMNNGVNTCSKSFLAALKNICDENNVCLIFDEVQTGFGWLGKLTAAERYNVTPSILAVGKALTSGNGPLAATIAERKYEDLSYGTAEKTSGADLRSLIAAEATLDRLLGIAEDNIPTFIHGKLRDELKVGLLKDVPKKSKFLNFILNDLKAYAPNVIGEIRGDHMIRGLEILNKYGKPDSDLAKKIANKALELGVLVRPSKHVLIIKPPIVVGNIELFEAINKLKDAIFSCCK